MPLTKDLEKQAKDVIYPTLNLLIDRYLKEGVSVKDMINHFKIKNNFNTLLKDISYAGRRFYEEGEDYPGIIRKILNEILAERLVEGETVNLKESMIINYSMYNKLYESVNISDVTLDFLFSDLSFSEQDKTLLAEYYNTKPELVTLKNPKYNLYSITDFKTDVAQNNRIITEVILLDTNNMDKIKKNVGNKIVSGLYAKIPDEVDYMDVRIKPHSVIDKKMIKDAIDGMIEMNDIVKVIAQLSGFVFDKLYGNYYMWRRRV